MEVASALFVYALTILIPIVGGLFLGIRAENRKRRQLLKSLWMIRRGGRN